MKKTNYLLSLILLVIVIAYTILVAKVDVKPVGPVNPATGVTSEVGFSTINSAIAKKLEYNSTFYKISKYAGYLAFAFIAFYGVIGLAQLIKKKNLKDINKVLYALAVFYVCVAIVYALFEVLTINYRPVVMENELEASYPSSHTMLAICVCGSSLIVSHYLVKKEGFKILLNIAAVIMMILIVVTRTLSGVHWFTDIVGAIIISVFMLQTFASSIKSLNAKEKGEREEEKEAQEE